MAVPEQLVDWAVAYADELERLLRFLLAMGAVYLLARLLVEPSVARIVRRSNPDNPTIQRAIQRHLRLVVVLIAIGAGTVAAGFGDVLASSNLVVAAATLAIGVAGQEVIGSIISGIFLVVNPAFSVGDWIRWDDREGEIVSIHFRTTRVRTPTNEIVTVPNTELTENTVVHRFGRDRLRLTQAVGVSYDADVEDAIERLEAAAAGTEEVLSAPRPRAYLQELDDEIAVLVLEYWVENPSNRTIAGARSALALAIVRSFEAAGLELGPASEYELDGQVDVRLTEEAG